MTLAEIPMEPPVSYEGTGAARVALLERRHRLSLVGADRHAEVGRLLHEVDAALARIDGDRFGRCEGCREAIEPMVLEAEPAARFCLDCMDAAERRRLGRDLELASAFQSALLPPPDLRCGGWELAIDYQPLGALGGDTCALVVPERGDGVLHFLFGDVAGKGVSASLLMAHLHALFRSMVALDLPLAETLARVNRLFCQSTTIGAYATAIAGRVEAGGRVELVNAGHPPALVHAGRSVVDAAGRGLPLGLFPGAEYASFELTLGPGEGLVLYTDGVSEAANAVGEEFGRAGLGRALSHTAGSSARAIVGAVLDELGRFRGPSPANDDATLLALRRLAG